jgi:DNA polymerase
MTAMTHVLLDHDTDFAGWRNVARSLALAGVAPNDLAWGVRGHAPELFEPLRLPKVDRTRTFHVPSSFIDLARFAILNRDPERFALLYRLLWRIRADARVMIAATDDDIVRVRGLWKEVRRDLHKMKAFLRFREFGRDDDFRFVSWFEPSH